MCFYQQCPRHGVVTQLIDVKKIADVMELLSEASPDDRSKDAGGSRS